MVLPRNSGMRGERTPGPIREYGLVRAFACMWIIHNRNLVAMDKPLRILIVLLLIEGENLAL